MNLGRGSGMQHFRWATAVLAVAAGLMLHGCSVKRTVKVNVPQKILSAKVATLDQVLSMLDENAARVKSLSSTTVRITFTSGKSESGTVQQYRSAPGYVLIERPDRIRLSVQNPLTKTAILELASVGDDFSIWYPGENKFFTGKNSARSFEIEGGGNSPAFNARPIHIYEAILPQAIAFTENGLRVAMREEQDSQAKYYVLSLYKEAVPPKLLPVRDVWVERSTMTIARQIVYEPDGAVESRIDYHQMSSDNVPLPLSMRIERPADGYSIDLEIRSWRLNPSFESNVFHLAPPPGAQHIMLQEKSRTGRL
jgi:outer membrane lipoprotein-sorting protein